MPYPIKLVIIACFASFESASVAAKARAMFGASNGAITIEPIIMATLLYKMPIEAVIAANITRARKENENFALELNLHIFPHCSAFLSLLLSFHFPLLLEQLLPQAIL